MNRHTDPHFDFEGECICFCSECWKQNSGGCICKECPDNCQEKE